MRVLRAFVVASVVCGFNPMPRAQLAGSIDGIQAVVHDSVITYQEVRDYTAQTLPRQYRTQPQVDQKSLEQMVRDNLEVLLERQLILHEFKAAGYSMPESVVDEEMQKYVARAGGRATVIKTLRAEGSTFEKRRQQLRDQIIIEAMRAKNIAGEIMISPHKIEIYYQNHTNDFKVKDQVKLRVIVLNRTSPDDPEARQLAEEIQAKIKEGATFSEMAAVYSQGSQRSQGGDWGWVERPDLRKELGDVAFALKPGESSGLIETPDACFLMLVEQTSPAHVKGLGEVRDEIEQSLLVDEQNRLQKQWIDRLKKKTFVRYF